MIEALQQMVTCRKMWFADSVKDYPYVCMEDYVLKNGEEYISQELDEEEKSIVKTAIKRAGIRFQIRQCFYNSQILSVRDPSKQLTYVEGFCYTSFFPFNHGWCEINGKVIDMTLRRKIDKGSPTLGSFNGREYRGCKFPRSIVLERMFVLAEGGSFLDDMMGSFPLLTGELLINHKTMTVQKGGYEHRRKKRSKRKEM